MSNNEKLDSLERKQQILSLNYYEHFKASEDIARAVGINNLTYKSVQSSLNDIAKQLRKIKEEIEELKK